MTRSSIIVAVAMLASSAQAATLTVPGTHGTIQSAINAANTFDVILVGPGTYNEAIDTAGKNITIRSTNGPAATTLDGTGLGTSIMTVNTGETSSLRIEGFTFANGTGSFISGALRGGAVYLNDAEPTFRDCIFRDNFADLGGAIYGSSSIFDVEMRNCLFYDNLAGSGGAIYMSGVSLTMTNCTVANNSAVQGAPFDGADGGGIFVSGQFSATRLTNSIVWGNSPDGVDASDPNVAFCNLQGGVAPGNGNISSNPLFVNPGAGDFGLSAGSQSVDAGDSTEVTDIAYDIAGKPRGVNDPLSLDTGELVFDICVDMGALERQDTTGGGKETCIGDIDANGNVDFNDLLEVLTRWGPCP